jgi:histidine ammonia-lyase
MHNALSTSELHPKTESSITLGEGYSLTIDDVDLISQEKVQVHLSHSPTFKEKINKGAAFLAQAYAEGQNIYGVTTGYGDNCTRSIPTELMAELPLNLTRFHGCGLGDFLSPAQSRAVLAIRLASLCQGYSGVSYALLERLTLLLNEDILPLIPAEGSVGASGDLTPLSYVAGVIVGERDVWYEGKRQPTASVYKQKGIEPYKLLPKEALALMNGTTVMTAFAVEVYKRAHYLMGLSCRLTSLTSLSLQGNPQHFDKTLFEAKPHLGQMDMASYIRQDLAKAPADFPKTRLQDRYSTRCAPHVIGVLADMLPTFKTLIETEINSANDNPLIDISEDQQQLLHGGHFYGGHIAFAMDGLKILVANIADLMDRQIAVLVDPKFSAGLPANLSSIEGPRAAINHGLKALQISASAWTAEALKGTMPASVFSRSTESHNQDKVSMGTIAARDALRVLELTEQVSAAHLITTHQALRLREREGVLGNENYPSDLELFLSQITDVIPFVQEDQPLDSLLRDLMVRIQKREWSLYGVFA